MTWDQLIGKIREGLTESSAHIRVVGELLAAPDSVALLFDAEAVHTVLTGLTLAMSDLHSTVEHLAVGVDAVVEALRDTDEPQEVEGE